MQIAKSLINFGRCSANVEPSPGAYAIRGSQWLSNAASYLSFSTNKGNWLNNCSIVILFGISNCSITNLSVLNSVNSAAL